MNGKQLPELLALERLIEDAGPQLDASIACTVAAGSEQYPVHVLKIGSERADAPVVGFFGGVHGLERIGSQVVIAFLQSLLARLRWDQALQRQLEEVRLVFMPLVNPGGMAQASRSNPRGVDLMRNSPVQASENVPFLLGGQRMTRLLPWFRGAFGAPMEAESRALCKLVEEELLPRSFSLALDCHSGFGLRDRIWFPHAHTSTPIAHLAEVDEIGRASCRERV
jgi:predicted deacylase